MDRFQIAEAKSLRWVSAMERARFRVKSGTPIEPGTCTDDTYNLDIVPNHGAEVVYNMTNGDKHRSAPLATTEIFPVEQASKLIYIDSTAHFVGADRPAVRDSGWRQLLDRRAGAPNSASSR